MKTETPILDGAIRSILLADWDPHGVEEHPAAHGTYDGYLAPLRQLIESRATEDQVIAYLHERELETMCFPPLGTERLRRVARKLLKLGEV